MSGLHDPGSMTIAPGMSRQPENMRCSPRRASTRWCGPAAIRTSFSPSRRFRFSPCPLSFRGGRLVNYTSCKARLDVKIACAEMPNSLSFFFVFVAVGHRRLVGMPVALCLPLIRPAPWFKRWTIARGRRRKREMRNHDGRRREDGANLVGDGAARRRGGADAAGRVGLVAGPGAGRSPRSAPFAPGNPGGTAADPTRAARRIPLRMPRRRRRANPSVATPPPAAAPADPMDSYPLRLVGEVA